MFSIEYTLTLSFSKAASRHYYNLRMLPRPELNVESEYLFVNGILKKDNARDSFNNRVVASAVVDESFNYTAHLSARIKSGIYELKEERSEYKIGYFRHPTALTMPSDKIKELALSLGKGDENTLAERAVELINNEMSYEKGVTDFFTDASSAFEMKKGVCQDYSHIMLSALRERGIICRYVAGITKGIGESHAWVEVLTKGVWKGYDPTRRKEADNTYFPFSYGRDSLDSPLNSGTYRGSEESKLTVSAIALEV